jgi:hypothetical protein
VGTFVMGGSNALVSASPDSLSGLPEPTVGATDVGSFDAPAASPLAEVPIPSGGPAATSAPAPAAAGEDAPSAAPTLGLVSRFTGLGFVMPFFVLLGSLAIGRGLHVLHGTLVNAPASTACLAEQE